MCEPVTIAMMVIGAVGAIAGGMAKKKAAKAEIKAINELNELKSEQIAEAAGDEMNKLTRAARRERAAARAAASEGGVNLGSNSFMAQLQATDINLAIDGGTVLNNASNAQTQRDAEARGRLGQISVPTNAGIALDAVTAAGSAYLGAGGVTYLGNQPGKG